MSWISGNRYLTDTEMRNNARIIEDYLSNTGWTLNAISALLGNMQSESTINPGIWQSLNEGNMSGGFGLVQWTPATNFTDWADANGFSWTDGNAQLLWIDQYTTHYGQWIPTEAYPMTFDEFKASSGSPEDLASAFLKNFERAGVEVEEERRTQARSWYTILSNGSDPEDPTPSTPSTPSKRKKFNFILFNRQRRRIV